MTSALYRTYISLSELSLSAQWGKGSAFVRQGKRLSAEGVEYKKLPRR